MKKIYSPAILLTTLILSLSFFTVSAQTPGTINTSTETSTQQPSTPSTSISGDTLCGKTAATECNIGHIKKIFDSMLSLFITLGSVLLVLFIVCRLVVSWWAFRFSDDKNAIKKAVNDSWQATLGFLMIFGLFFGFVYLLRMFGIQEFILRVFSEGFVTHAYAQTTMFPNPTSANNAYDLLMLVARALIRWIIYPAIIFMWVMTGFAYVAAQGKPEAIKKAHAYILGAALITIAVVMTQGFIFALRNSAQQILPNNGAARTQSPSPDPIGTPDGRGTPTPGAAGSACTTASGGTGQRGSDGSCTNRSDSYNTTPVPVTNRCPLYSRCTTDDGQAGTCVQGNASRDYAIYCSPTNGAGVSPTPSTSGQTDFVITPN